MLVRLARARLEAGRALTLPALVHVRAEHRGGNTRPHQPVRILESGRTADPALLAGHVLVRALTGAHDRLGWIDLERRHGQRPSELEGPALRVLSTDALHDLANLGLDLIERLARKRATVEGQSAAGSDQVLLRATVDPPQVDARTRQHRMRALGVDGPERV